MTWDGTGTGRGEDIRDGLGVAAVRLSRGKSPAPNKQQTTKEKKKRYSTVAMVERLLGKVAKLLDSIRLPRSGRAGLAGARCGDLVARWVRRDSRRVSWLA